MSEENREKGLTTGQAMGLCILMTFVIMTIFVYIANPLRTPGGYLTGDGGLIVMIGVIIVIAMWVWMFGFYKPELAEGW